MFLGSDFNTPFNRYTWENVRELRLEGKSKVWKRSHPRHHIQTYAYSSLEYLKYQLDISRYAGVHKFVSLGTDLISSSNYQTCLNRFFSFWVRRPYVTTQTAWQFTQSSLSCELKLMKQDVPFSNNTKIFMINKRYSPTFQTKNWTLTSRNEHHSTENDSITCNHPEVYLPQFPREE